MFFVDKVGEGYNVIFCVDTRDLDKGDLKTFNEYIEKITKDIRSTDGNTANIYLYNESGIVGGNIVPKASIARSGDILELDKLLLNTLEDKSYNHNLQSYVFIVTNGRFVYANPGYSNKLSRFIDDKMHISLICGIENKLDYQASFIYSLVEQTSGTTINLFDMVVLDSMNVSKSVLDYLGIEVAPIVYLSSVSLTFLPEEFDLWHLKNYHEEYLNQQGVYTLDTDSDGLMNYEEIDFEAPGFGFYYDGSVELPTLGLCLGNNEKGYVKRGLDRLKEKYYHEDGKSKAWYDTILNVTILPILSDPVSKDGDGDGRTDLNDKNPLIYYPLVNYNRDAAIAYAEQWYDVSGFADIPIVGADIVRNFSDSVNNYFYYYSSDCANFVSQCLHAGGYKMYGHGRDDGWHSYHIDENSTADKAYEVSESWSVANTQYEYFIKSDYAIEVIQIDNKIAFDSTNLKNKISEYGIQLGDMIMMDLEGDGYINHATIINDVTDTLLYAAHTSDQWNENFKNVWGRYPDCVMYVICLGN
jgi:hypothetical protein